MNKLPLLPNSIKKFGWVLFFAGLIAFIAVKIMKDTPSALNISVISLFNSDKSIGFAGIIENNVLDEIVSLLLLVGLYMVGFAREKVEDDITFYVRLSSLLWALIVSGFLLTFAFLFLYDMAFLQFMMYNLFTLPLIYVARFNYIMSRKIISPDA